jgi:TolA-binding protein
MTKPIVDAPARWTDSPTAMGNGGLGELLRAVEAPTALSAAALAQVHARLRASRSSSSVPRRVREAVLAGVMLMAGSSLAVAGWGVTEWWSGRVQHQPRALVGPGAAPVGLRSSSKRAAAARPAPAPLESAKSPELSSVGLGSVVAFPVAKGSQSRNAALADSSALASESSALEGALVKLRREHDAQGALALLDQSEPLFARGALALEAQVARVDALLLLGRQGEALAILERLPLAHIGRGGELRLQRAELRAKSDCGLALADFDVLVRQALASPLAERALYGRAVCEARVGDSQAQRDFLDYISRFPEGRFADQARKALARLPGKVTQ